VDRFGAGIVVDILKTYPEVLVSGIVIDNPYYLTADEFLARRGRRSGGQPVGPRDHAPVRGSLDRGSIRTGLGQRWMMVADV
jgi:hypothetical protein